MVRPWVISVVALAMADYAVGQCARGSQSDVIVDAPFEHPVTVNVPKSQRGVLIEETGSDLEFRFEHTGDFQDINVRPPRLGVVAISGEVGSIEIRSKRFQAPGRALIHLDCARSEDIAFFDRLQVLYRTSIDSSPAAATNSIPAIKGWLKSEEMPERHAWLLQTYANALVAAGKNVDAARVFQEARAAWLALGDRSRAAVDLMASGEDASRSGDFAQAQQRLESAESELLQVGPTYYRLRTVSARCLIKSRQGQVADAVACDERVAREFRDAGETAEAGVRDISIANQWLKLGDRSRARDALLRADTHADALSLIATARLSAAFGTYYLQSGDLAAAARDLATASEQFRLASLPQDQANVDIKLARLAHMAGAYSEELRLLDRAVGHLDPKSAREQIAEALLRGVEANAMLGRPKQAREQLAQARTLCTQLGKSDCLDQIDLSEARAWMDSGELDRARASFARLRSESPRSNTLKAWFDAIAIENEAPAAALMQARLVTTVTRSDPDLAMEIAIVSARRWRADGNSIEATELLLSTLEAMSREISSWPSIAMRIGARGRMIRLQQEIFDLVRERGKGPLDHAAAYSIFAAINAASARRVFAASPAPEMLPEDVRHALSNAVASGTAIDQRSLFLTLASAGGTGSTGAKPARAAREENAVRPWLFSSARRRLLVPLLGDKQFQLLISNGKVLSSCMDMTADEYVALANRFDEALEGDSSQLRALDTRTAEFVDAIQGCFDGDDVGWEWTVLSTPGTPMLPWPWIAAAADGKGLREPVISVVFSGDAFRAHRELRPSAVEVLDLNLPGARALPGTIRETRGVSRALQDGGLAAVNVRAGSIVASDVMRQMSTRGAWLHLMGHSNDVRYGQLYAGIWVPNSGKPSILTVPELAANASTASLVVLSACGTGVLGQSTSSASITLAEAMLASGVRAVIASSNSASDNAAPYWTEAFYRELLKTGDEALAVQAARRQLRNSPHFRHPRFWAALNSMNSLDSTSIEFAP